MVEKAYLIQRELEHPMQRRMLRCMLPARVYTQLADGVVHTTLRPCKPCCSVAWPRVRARVLGGLLSSFEETASIYLQPFLRFNWGVLYLESAHKV